VKAFDTGHAAQATGSGREDPKDNWEFLPFDELHIFSLTN
jgi:hypothetical protein